MNRSKTRDPRFWRRWVLSGAMGPTTPAGAMRMQAWPDARRDALCVGWRSGHLRQRAECAWSWSRVSLATARPGDSWPIYATSALADFDARCRQLAMQHGAPMPDVCRVCGAEYTGCVACWCSGHAAGSPGWYAARAKVAEQMSPAAMAFWADEGRRLRCAR